MEKIDEKTQEPFAEDGVFRISAEPVVGSRPAPEPPAASSTHPLGELPASYGADLLYAIARDPETLFLYWDLDWPRRFAEAGLEARPVHLRVLREDESEASTREIDPADGSCFVEVSAPGTRYLCELGCFEGTEWKSLIRSGATTTPDSELSEEATADFATLPLHLSFQRLIEIFRATGVQRDTLAQSVAGMQSKARVLQGTMPAGDWEKLVEAAADSVQDEAGLGMHGADSSELAALLRPAPHGPAQRLPLPENFRRFGRSSWGRAS